MIANTDMRRRRENQMAQIVHLTGVRNFDYRSRNDFTVRYEEREV
jgi:hypothetical protein